MAKECLRRAFRAIGVAWHEGPTNPPDSHGEFGTTEGWRTNAARRTQIQQWLSGASPNYPGSGAEIAAVAHALLAGVPGLSEYDLVQYVQNTLFNRIDAAANDHELSGIGLAERLAEGAILPMYGMPSRSRALYHTKQFRDGRYQLLTIDRDLDLAISEFAPGSQKTKDKRIHRSVGFTPSLELEPTGRLRELGDSPFLWQRWLSKCGRCHYAMTTETAPGNPNCPQCASPRVDVGGSYSAFLARVPTAFRTDLSEGEDAKEDDDIVIAGSARLAQSDAIPPLLVVGTNTALAFTQAGHVFAVNDNNGRLFAGRLASDVQHQLQYQWREDNTGAATESIAIVSPKTTDLLSAAPSVIPAGLRLDPLSVGAGVKAAFSSAAFILRAAAADILDIDPEELDINYLRRRENSPGRFVGEIVISDFLANGSGFTRWLADNWSDCLEAILAPMNPNSFPAKLIAADHRVSCSTACYDCLKNYRNMPYHGLLDWRLGLSLLRILSDPAARCGLDGDFEQPGIVELNGWLGMATARRDSFCQAFEAATPATFGPLPGFTLASGLAVIVVHSLWDCGGGIDGIAAVAFDDASAASGADDRVRFVDPFNLERRPSWVYQNIAELT
jgi:hypothetical protein